MIYRFLVIGLVIIVLGGLVAYSKFVPEPNVVSGFLEADEIRIGSRIGGRVKSVLVEEGDPVSKGQLLVELEPFDLLQREQEAIDVLAQRDADYQRLKAGFRVEEIAQAEARYQQSQAYLDKLKAGPREQEIKAARGRVEVADAALVLAKQNFTRRNELFEKNTISREEFDSASKELEAAIAEAGVRTQELDLLEAGTREEEIREAEGQLAEAKAAYELVKNGSRKEDIAEAKAARDAAQASVEVIREQKKELQIVSSVNGFVEALDLQPGDLVGASAPVLSVLDQENLWVRCYVPQNRHAVEVGEKLRVTVDGLPDEEYLGEVVFVSRQAEFTPSNVQTLEDRSKLVFRTKVELDEKVGRLRPGMTVNVSLAPIEDAQ
ncbi:HlyD family secretion protein [Bremerella sp. P1]|uniref:HlyD family secretion protein n=1 Tax=Bremerella sp. P1 TaxID=3026424 RepID=UPI002367F6A4|nr:efflux RND transporter periplasmic adaptor subunit [Bremerella sp. P1]WDI40950.1 efflux RND transporter periplasmic adaptor subunit [Bremerella sp. P1]